MSSSITPTNPDITIGEQQPAKTSVTMNALPYYEGDYGMNISNPPTAQIVIPHGSVIDSDTGRVVKPEDYLIQIPGVPKPLHLPANASKKEVEDLSQELHELWNAKGR
jgi:hypothetical protein